MRKKSNSRIKRLKKTNEFLIQKFKKEAREEKIAYLLSLFDKESINYEVIFDDYDDLTTDTPRNWIQHHYTFQSWGKINSKPLKNSRVFNYDDYKSYTEVLNQIIQQEHIEPEFVYIIWGSQPLLKMQLFDVVEYAFFLFGEYWCTWIVCPEEGWCIEHNNMGDISFLPVEKN